MCGRFSLTAPGQLWFEIFGLLAVGLSHSSPGDRNGKVAEREVVALLGLLVTMLN